MVLMSVVIPTLNRAKVLSRVLEALCQQTMQHNEYEIVVVDDGSTDGTKAGVEEVAKRESGRHTIKYVKQDPSKKGPASANNLGIRNASGRYILFMNDDVIADKELLREHARSHSLHSRVIVQGRVINTSSLDELGKKHNGYAGGYSDMSFGYFTTWNCSVEKALLEQAGMFDEDFRELCWEDVEFGYRLRRLGVKQIYNKAAFGYHFRHEFKVDNIGWVKHKSVNMGRNAVLYYRKHPTLDVKISTESFWLPMTMHSFMSFGVRMVGGPALTGLFKWLEKRGMARTLSFLVGLAGKYWYYSGVKDAMK